jgi:Flp pilus assembly protein TadG
MSQITRPNRQRLIEDVRGNVAVLFGVALIPIVLGVGVAVD